MKKLISLSLEDVVVICDALDNVYYDAESENAELTPLFFDLRERFALLYLDMRKCVIEDARKGKL